MDRPAVDKAPSLPKGKTFGDIRGLIKKIEQYITPAQCQMIEQAFWCAKQAHSEQTRASGQPYVSHPVTVAHVLADMRMDADSVAAAILHDVIEDTPVSKEELAAQFGQEVADIVDGVSKLDKLKFDSQEEAKAESFRKMMLAMTHDLRVILIKLADRLHNMNTLDFCSPEKQRRIARETIEIYAPIAHRFGINRLRIELEDLSFKYLYPNRYRVINNYLTKALGDQKKNMRDVAAEFRRRFMQHDLFADIEYRQKNRYSIYRKMRIKGRALSDILDVLAFRVIVEKPDDCYRALGIVHQVFRPVPGRFKDYLAIPKLNGYQSLHTTLFGPKGIPIEVQIRTKDMDRVAESGIAAHWLFKAASPTEARAHARAKDWLNSLIDMHETGRSEEFLENIKLNLFPDQVYLFTPDGDIMRLPRGATAIDFAYAVHTDVGHHTVAAKIDRRLCPLRTPLKSGQTVEIITEKSATPNPAWVNFVVTAKARANIRSYLRGLKRNKAVSLGRRLLDNALGDFSASVRKLESEQIQHVLDELGLDDSEALYEQIGLGKQLASLVARRLLNQAGKEDATLAEHAPLAIAGTEGLVVSFARCCYPILGDEVMGFLSSGRGVMVHRECCGNLAEFRKQPEKWIAVQWSDHIEREFQVQIEVDAFNKMGVLATVAASIADAESNIESMNVVEKVGDVTTMTFLLNVRDRTHLAEVIRHIRRIRHTLRVSRTCQ